MWRKRREEESEDQLQTRRRNTCRSRGEEGPVGVEDGVRTSSNSSEQRRLGGEQSRDGVGGTSDGEGRRGET